MIRIKSLATLILLFLILGCKPEAEQVENNVYQEKKSYKEVTNISYYEKESPNAEQAKLNLLIPKTNEKVPIFMWIGQGAWAYVNPDREMPICRNITENGIAVASVGHRLSPALIWKPFKKKGIKHPEHIKDIAQAFKWVYENADKYGYSKEHIYVGGYSSGAQLAALLAMDSKYLRKLGLSTSLIKAIIPVAGTFDIKLYKKELLKEDPSQKEKHFDVVFGTTDKEIMDSSPVTFIDSLRTPILMISEQSTYLYHQAFEEILVERNYKNFESINFHDKTHANLWIEMGRDKENLCLDYISNYIKKMSYELFRGKK